MDMIRYSFGYPNMFRISSPGGPKAIQDIHKYPEISKHIFDILDISVWTNFPDVDQCWAVELLQSWAISASEAWQSIWTKVFQLWWILCHLWGNKISASWCSWILNFNFKARHPPSTFPLEGSYTCARGWWRLTWSCFLGAADSDTW